MAAAATPPASAAFMPVIHAQACTYTRVCTFFLSLILLLLLLLLLAFQRLAFRAMQCFIFEAEREREREESTYSLSAFC